MTAKQENRFFAAMGLACLVFVLAGFAPSFYLRDAARPPLPSLFLVHGGILTAWYLIAAAQPLWIAAGRFSAHRALGAVGAVIAIGVVVSGLMAGADAFARGVAIGDDPYAFFYLSVADAAFFAVFVIVAVAWRGRAHSHKRLMTIASISITFPALARLMAWLGLDPILAAAPYAALLAAIAAYDFVALRRLHPATLAGGGAAIAKLVSYLPVGGSALWRSLVDASGLAVEG